MSTQDTLCFADYDPVTGAPTVDGFTGIHDDLVVTHESDAGYVLGSRLTYDSGSGFPPVIFQGVKNGNFLNLAFFCRFDLSFDLRDVIVIALRPRVSNPAQDTARRLDIFPVYESVGADDKNPATGGPAGTPDDVPAGVPAGYNYHIRTDHDPQNTRHYRGQNAGDPWTTVNPDGSPYAPTNVIHKTRSWLPPVITLARSRGTQTLPTPPGTAFTFSVNGTAAFPPEGLFSVEGQIIKYTGKTGTSFTGCTGGTGTVPDGSGVSIPEVAWSIEVQLPLTSVHGGANWIDLQDSFGLYFGVVRVGKTPASGSTVSQGWYSTQFLFPVGTGNYLTGNLNETTSINPSWYGTGLIPALQTPPGSNLGLGVRFINGELGIGVRNTTSPAWSTLGGEIRGTNNTTTGDNRLVAQVENTAPTAANGVQVEFRFANWGLGPGSFYSWAPPVGAVNDAPSGITVPATGTAEITWTWPKASVPSDYDPPRNHQCVWAQLTSTSGVNFTQSSVRRNLKFVDLSTFREPATISGVGYPTPSGGFHSFLLMAHVRFLQVSTNERSNFMRSFEAPYLSKITGKDRTYWLWVVEGYRRTGQTITIDGQECEILDETPGSFGLVLQHERIGDVFIHGLLGAGIQLLTGVPGLNRFLGGGVFALKVPHNDSIEILVRIAAGLPLSKLCDDNPNDPSWLRLLKSIGCLILRFLQFIKRPISRIFRFVSRPILRLFGRSAY